MAQSAPLDDQESTSLLEHEMERAYASLTVADGATVSFALGPLDAMSFSSSPSEIQEPKANAVVEHQETAPQVSEVIKSQPIVVEEAKAEEEYKVAAAVATDASIEAAPHVIVEAEPQHAQQLEAASENAGGLWLSSPAPHVEEAVSSKVAEPEKPEAAFAAAASSGSVPVSAVASSVITPDGESGPSQLQ